MSSADESIALFTEPDGPQTPECFVLYPATCNRRAAAAEDTWSIRRAIVRARSALSSMRLDDASRVIAHLRRLLSHRADAYCSRYMYALRILEASVLSAQDDFSGARSVLTSVASHSGDNLAATLLRYAEWKQSGGEEVCAPDTTDYLAAPVGGKALDRIVSLCVNAALAFDRLQLAVSAALATEALQLTRLRYGNHSPISSFPATLLAQVAYEQGRLEEVEALLRPRLSVIRATGTLECVARASVLLARVSLHRGRHRPALTILRETEALARARRWPRLARIASAEYARVLEILHYEERQGCASGLVRDKASVIVLQRSGCASIRLQSPRAAAPPRMSLRPSPLSTPATRDSLPTDEALSFSAVEAALQRVCFVASHGSIDDSFELLIPCLRIGAARGLRMVLVDAGRPFLALLERLYYALPADDSRLCDLRPYIASLLRATVQTSVEERTSIACRPLSRRETGVLQMIAHGMSNKRIAQSLGITPETVKSHAKSIFVKLATRTRAQAVARAEAIGFL
jgi:LuxR family transcriptional regulator, maltose regulon positive regulatory protein